MPLVSSSSYQKAPWFLRTGHWETLYAGVVRRVRGVRYKRERLTLSDGDFVDLDWIKKGFKKLTILAHGLEGNSERIYMKGMAKYFSTNGWDILAWNCRSCSGEMNKAMRLYHHGEIEDLSEVVKHVANKYDQINLIGFSMGGSIILKYLGEMADKLPGAVHSAVSFSAPCDLKATAEKLDEPNCRFYKKRFLALLKEKMLQKAKLYPNVLDARNFDKIKVWADFDNYFTAPLNGFKDANAFYKNASAVNFMENINIPTLLVNAKNDPILTPSSSPLALAKGHPFIHLETPDKGGHVAFSIIGDPFNWSEYRAMEFINNL